MPSPRLFWFFLTLFWIAPYCGAQPAADDLFPTYAAFRDSLDRLVAIPDEAARQIALDTFWNDRKAAGDVPFARGENVAFLYRGAAASVAWNGDFNGWSGDTSFANQGERLGETNLWLLEAAFPPDARLDYKIVVDGNWILDPANSRQQWSGFGPNSELQMPEYTSPPEVERLPDVLHGTLHPAATTVSASLGYAVSYRVYTPARYTDLAGLPVIYVTDGHEYADDRLGSMIVVLDNLIGKGVIEPVLAVFIDPREPGNLSNNRRVSQYADDYEAFAAFLADELVPLIDANWRTDPSAEARGILGTSLGGLFSAYLGAVRSDVFQRIAVHSPAFWYDTQRGGDQVYQLYQQAERLPLDIFMSTGTIHDTEDSARRMKALFVQKGYPLDYIEVNEGHSWGNWRALIDAPLMQFWGTGTQLGLGDTALPGDLDLHSYPNPFRFSATIAFALPHAQRVTLGVYDMLGRRRALLLESAMLPAGTHALPLAPNGWPSGIYLYRLVGETVHATGRLLYAR